MQFDKLANNILLKEWIFSDSGDPGIEDLNLSKNKTYTIYCPSEGHDDGEDLYFLEFQLSEYTLNDLWDHLELVPFFKSPFLTAATGEEGDAYFEGKGFALKKAGNLFAEIGRRKDLNWEQKEELFKTEMTNFLQSYQDFLKHTDADEQEDITEI
jgi:hypothetical protein